MFKKPKVKFIPPMGMPQKIAPEIPLQEFKFTSEVFKDPKGIVFDFTKKREVLKNIEQAYLQAWMSQKLIEITYQRFLHDDLDKGGLVVDALKNELTRTQNEIRIAEGMLDTLKSWVKSIK